MANEDDGIKEGHMALTEKQRKKLNRRLMTQDEKLSLLFKILSIQYFVLFCAALMWDIVAKHLSLQYQPGISYGQISVSAFFLVQCIIMGTKVR
jgi:hypothetical protein